MHQSAECVQLVPQGQTLSGNVKLAKAKHISNHGLFSRNEVDNSVKLMVAILNLDMVQ